MKKIKILHTADLHMDSPFESLSQGKAAIRRSELRLLPQKIARLAIQEKVDLVLLAGDLLDSDSVYRETGDELFKCLSKIPAPVVIAPGNHDYYHDRCVYAKMDLPDNIYLFTKQTVECFEFKDRGYRVYGAAFTDKSSPALIKDFKAVTGDDIINIMCLHGEVNQPQSAYNPITSGEIENSGIDYLALGHIHKASGLQKAGLTYWSQCGCPEGRGFDETGKKTVNIVETDGENCMLREVSISSRRYEQIAVDVTDSDPLLAIQIALPDETVRDIYRIVLKGETPRPVALNSLYEQLEEYFFEVQIKDETSVREDIWEKEGNDSLRGLFLMKMKEKYQKAENESEKRWIEQSVRWGLAAMDNQEELIQHQ